MSKKRKPNISRDTFVKMIEAGDRMASFIYNLLQGSHKLTDAHTAEVVGEWKLKWDVASRRALTEDNQDMLCVMCGNECDDATLICTECAEDMGIDLEEWEDQ